MKSILNAICAKGLPKRDLKNANRVNLFALLWALTLMLSTYLGETGVLDNTLLLIIAFAVHSMIGIAMLLTYKNFLTQLDEMERKVQLDALALAVGVAIISFSSYSILANTGTVPPLNSAYLIALIALTYMVGIIKGRLAYR
ncbi:Conserved hypothetical protein [Shewanella piezotolerans WP3]|uniref:Uncharacterized protein n=1 Tax=Shewanella piezotolerans (strain WP3 / JCM 13877) TaxID=225849 RepID=B8CH31_SHEPW|nr:hypothetical protein [Shewanella piezotolerans]ACJ27024.1 Conserved hypothetical protein [Shewanella piezotolerans WP3]